MSLRSDVKSALEVLGPVPAGLPERVIETVIRDQPVRRRRERLMFRLRVPLSLVAVVVAVALVAAALVGGRLLQEGRGVHGAVPAGQPGALNYQSELVALEARPVVLPHATSAATCPDNSGSNSVGYDYGNGPVFANGGPEIKVAWGYYFDVGYFTSPELSGPVLVRGRDLMTGRSLVFVGANSAGPIVGTDPSQSPPEQHSELVLDASNPAQRNLGYGFFAVRQGMPFGWVGCFGIQIDGPTFTERITGFAAP